jgi:hypothetical protein
MTRKKKRRTVSVARHGRDCRVCLHPLREQIEQDFVGWESAAKIAKDYRLGSRNSVYRHAHFADLFSQRDANVRAALGRIVERGANCRVTASTVVHACAVLAKLNSRGQLIDRSENVGSDFYDQWTHGELERYVMTGQWPSRFPTSLSGTPIRSKKNGRDVN